MGHFGDEGAVVGIGQGAIWVLVSGVLKVPRAVAALGRLLVVLGWRCRQGFWVLVRMRVRVLFDVLVVFWRCSQRADQGAVVSCHAIWNYAAVARTSKVFPEMAPIHLEK